MGEFVVQYWNIIWPIGCVTIAGAFTCGVILGRIRTRILSLEEKVKELFKFHNERNK